MNKHPLWIPGYILILLSFGCTSKLRNPQTELSGTRIVVSEKLLKSGDVVSVPYSAPSAPAGLSSLKLEFAANGVDFIPIADLDPNQSTYNWTVPIASGTQALLKITAVDTKGIAGYSTSTPFQIVSKVDLYSGIYNPGGSIDGVNSPYLRDSRSLSGAFAQNNTLYYVDGNAIRSIDVTDPQNILVKTVAGSKHESGTTDAPNGPATSARFNGPRGIAGDGNNLFISDWGNHSIRKIDLTSGAVTTLAGLSGASGAVDGIGPIARWNNPVGILYVAPDLYVAAAGNRSIRKVSLTGTVTTIAGNLATAGYLDHATGTSARFNNPYSIATDGSYLYVSEPASNATIRKIDLTGTYTVTTLAGIQGVLGYNNASTGTSSTFTLPYHLTVDSQYVYVSDVDSSATIRKINKSTGQTSLLAGTFGMYGVDDGGPGVGRLTRGAATAILNGELYQIDSNLRKINLSTGVVTTLLGPASLEMPYVGDHIRLPWIGGLAIFGNDVFMFSERSNMIQKFDLSTNYVTRYSGSYEEAGSTDGLVSQALFSKPASMVLVGSNYYVADYGNHTIRKIDSSGNVTTIIGLAGTSGYTNGTGNAARLKNPSDLVAVGNNLFVVDFGNHAIRKIDLSTLAVTTFAGSNAPTATSGTTDHTTGTSARFNSPKGITAIGTDLYVTDTNNNRIRKITSAGSVTTLAGSSIGYAEGTGTSAQFRSPRSITTDGIYLYVLDNSNAIIRKIDPNSGSTSLLIGTPGVSGNTNGIGINAKISLGTISMGSSLRYASGKLYLADMNNEYLKMIDLSTNVVSILAGGGQKINEGPALASSHRGSYGSFVKIGDSIYFGSQGTIRKIDSQRNITILTGGTESGIADGSLSTAKFSGITSLATDGKNIFVFQGINHNIRKIDLSAGVVSTLAGTSGVSGTTDASNGTEAKLNRPDTGCTDSSYLYVMDQGNHTIRTVHLASTEVKTLAGIAGTAGTQDGNSTTAKFDTPIACIKINHSLFISDSGNYTIRKIDLSDPNNPIVSTVIGQTGVSGSTDGIGTAATLRNVTGMTTDGIYVYFAESSSIDPLIRRFRLDTYQVSTFLGQRGQEGAIQDSLVTSATLKLPTQILYTDQGIFFTDTNNGLRWIH